ncbi:MAG: GreA/GreB family elongation factor [Bacteroidetes bacterium]|nr:GreA/GreB family elongation factor [Bacteroidota bacterium]
MTQKSKAILLREDDYETLITYLRNSRYANNIDANNKRDLQAEIKKATRVSKELFPDDVIRLNSKIRIRDVQKNNVMELVLVMPDEADIKQKKISVMAPVGTALIGFKKGEKINWHVPAGERTFAILDVVNQAE